jgi:hypothetical protein
MITAAFLAFAAYLFFGKDVTERVKTYLAAHPISVDPRHVAAAALLLAAAFSYANRHATPAPPPAPLPPDAFSLRGAFVGATAAEDAAMLSALLSELADCIEFDGKTAEPRLKTGVAFDDLRIAAREARMKGESLGDRQPKVKAAVHQFLDQAVGTSGGPVTAESRRAWVLAFRDLAEAAAEATR